MNPRDRFDDDALAKESQFKSDLGKELLGFIDDKTAPHEFLLLDEDADQDEALDLQSMGIAPFVTRGDGDDGDV